MGDIFFHSVGDRHQHIIFAIRFKIHILADTIDNLDRGVTATPNLDRDRYNGTTGQENE